MFDITLTSDSTGEPRIEDLTLASMLGFERTRNIRGLVERHAIALERLGALRFTMEQTSPFGGRPGRTTWLTERQALYLCTKSETPNAVDITIAIVEAFVAFRRGEAPVNADPRLSAAVRDMAASTAGRVDTIWRRMLTAHGISDPLTMTKAQVERCLAWCRQGGGYVNATPEAWRRRWHVPGHEAECELLHDLVRQVAGRLGCAPNWWYRHELGFEPKPWRPAGVAELRHAIARIANYMGPSFALPRLPGLYRIAPEDMYGRHRLAA